MSNDSSSDNSVEPARQGIPEWFRERRYGLFVHMAIATVPAFAPTHEYSEWYQSHLAPTPLDDVILHPAPMPEVLDWHARHHGNGSYDDFIDQLTMSKWDADGIAGLAGEAGMRYVIHTSKHHDGYCFFDSGLTERTTMHSGPRRDPVRELADASRNAGLVYGLYYSLLDWSHPAYGSDSYVADYLHPQVRELIDKYQPSVLWGDGHWGRPPTYWRSDELLAEYYQALGGDGIANDRWGATHNDYVTFEYDTPSEQPGKPFEVCRGVGYSFGWNRAERIDDHLTPSQLIDLLTETVAKGGNLLINIGPRADGSVPAEQADVLRAAGVWVRSHEEAIHGSTPFEQWGDERIRYTVSPSDDGLIHLNVIDLAAGDAAHLSAITADRYEVVDAGDAAVEVGDRGTLLRSPARGSELATVSRLVLRERPGIAATVSAPAGPAARIGARTFSTISDALAAANPGDVVDVSDGRFSIDNEALPLRVGAGVEMRGHALAVFDVGADGPGTVIELVGNGAVVRGLSFVAASPSGFAQPVAAISAVGVADVRIIDCRMRRAAIRLARTDGVVVTGNELTGGGIVIDGSRDVEVSHNRQRGNRWGAGIALSGCSDSVVHRNVIRDDLVGVHISNSDGVVLTSNELRTRWWGFHLDRSSRTSTAHNEIESTMRAVCVTGGDDHLVLGNTMTHCDSATLVESDAANVSVVDNSVIDCRLAVLAWECDEPTQSGNRVVRPQEVPE